MSSPPQKNAGIHASDTSTDRQASTGDRQPHTPQSQPTIIAYPEKRYEPFPLTDIQQAYWVGRGNGIELGGVSTHYYSEIDCHNLDLNRLNHAWQELIARHDMLRVIILPSGQQQVLEEVPDYEFALHDLQHLGSDRVESTLHQIREEMSHLVLPGDQWPLFQIRVTLLDKTHFRIHLSFDALTIDARSRYLLFHEWSQIYHKPDIRLPDLTLTFRDFVIAEAERSTSLAYEEAETYWNHRLPSLPPPPALPLLQKPSSIMLSRFSRLQGSLDAQTWHNLKQCASNNGIRPSIFLLAAFSECLKFWSRSSRSMTLNLTLFNRMASDERLSGVVGDFTSSTLLAIDNEGEPTFKTRALHIQAQLMEDLAHSEISGVKVIRKLFQHQWADFGAVMPVVFTSLLSLSKQFKDTPAEWLGKEIYDITQTPQVAFDHQVIEDKGALIIKWDVVEELFPENMLQDMLDAYMSFLRHLGQDEGSWDAPWHEPSKQLLPQYHRQLYEAVNSTAEALPVKRLHELFFQQCSLKPEHLAVISRERNLTYQELLDLSSRVGHWLSERNVTPNTLVAIVMEKGWEQVVGVLGVLQSGAAYVPIDPTLPKDRLWHLLDQAQASLVLTQPCIDQVIEWPTSVVRLHVSNAALEHLDNTPLPFTQEIDDLAYVIFTSGSTGKPKGVAIDHRGPANTILDINHRFNIGSNDKALALASLSFDLSVYDIFGTLAAGATIVMPDASEAKDPACWHEILQRENISIWNSVPALMKLLVEYIQAKQTTIPDSLRLVFLSGDWIPLNLPDQIYQLNSKTQVISLGGATEASIWSIIYPVKKIKPQWKSIPYGKPISNQRFYVFNDAMEPCPLWVTGQLYIAGTGLAKGYWHDEEKTDTSFIFHPESGERLYRTGDLGRFLPDGNIEFLGREDFQVKIQGYRVESGEIETTLEQHASIKSAVVSTQPGTDREERRLVAYVVPNNYPAPTPTELHEFLRQKLPVYMIPHVFMTLEELPLTVNGKIDRSRLPSPGHDASTTHDDLEAAVSSDLRTEVAKLIASTLNVEHIDHQANLMDLGINSVDMMRLALLIEQTFDFRPRIMELIRLRTVIDIADYCARSCPKHISPTTKEDSSRPISQLVKSFPVLLDPNERVAFKEKQSALLEIKDEHNIIRLPVSEITEEDNNQTVGNRRSHRAFSNEPITINQLSGLLSCLRQVTMDSKHKYAYGSAGGLYPVQTYLYIKKQRIDGIASGIYYYHPVNHSLVPIITDVKFNNDIFGFTNRAIFNNAGFAIIMIGEIKAIAPVYDDLSYKFCLIEAGLMTQLLESKAPENNIGLCQMGNMDFERVRHLFALNDSQIYLHALVGGTVKNANDPGNWITTNELNIFTIKKQQKTSTSNIGLVLTQDQGAMIPFFFMQGEMWEMTQYLGPDQPLYWFSLQHEPDLEYLSHSASIEEIAAYYLNEIKKIRPDGPYVIGGYCIGAVIAYEIAQQLRRETKNVPLLVLIDPLRPGPSSLSSRVIKMLHRIPQKQGMRNKISYLLQASSRPIGRPINENGINPDSYEYTSQKHASSKESRSNLYTVALKSRIRYLPQTYPGPVLLFWSKEQTQLHKSREQWDAPGRWNRLLKGDLKTCIIPDVGHHNIFDEPYVRDIADKLNTHLHKVQEPR